MRTEQYVSIAHKSRAKVCVKSRIIKPRFLGSLLLTVLRRSSLSIFYLMFIGSKKYAKIRN